jgi:hypothetical protein
MNNEWFDLWSKVARAEPVVIRGCQNFSLKSMAKALHAHGLIRTTWTDGPTDGLGTMVGAWWCAKNAGTNSMARMPLMRDIKKYNEVDCKVMMEFVRLLRREH